MKFISHPILQGTQGLPVVGQLSAARAQGLPLVGQFPAEGEEGDGRTRAGARQEEQLPAQGQEGRPRDGGRQPRHGRVSFSLSVFWTG